MQDDISNLTREELVAKISELEEENEKLKGVGQTRGRGVAVGPGEAGAAEVDSLRAENEKLKEEIKSLTLNVSNHTADRAEVVMLSQTIEDLENTIRILRNDSKNTRSKQQQTPPLTPETPKLAPSSHNLKVANIAAAAVGEIHPSPAPKRSLNLEGYLQKQGGGWGPFKAHFKERYFELRGAQGTLYYSAKKGGEQLGEIPLEQTTCAEASIRPFSFCLLGPNLQRNYILAAATEAERKKWMEAITYAAAHFTKQVCGAGQPRSPGNTSPVQGSFLGNVIEDTQEASCVCNSTVVEATPTLEDFELLVVVGVGSFGKVLKVRHRKDGRIYAMKVLQKDMIVKHHMVTHTKAEKEILEASNHAFVVKMHFAFQTRRQLIFVLDFLTGGELFFHLVNEHRFSEARAKFYAFEIALALQHLHQRNIIYRDLKPENLVLDCDGHVCLTDFGLAKTQVTDLTHTFCGTPQYMAPELILKQGHGRAADWWSLGVFLFEMIVGVAPFPNNGNTRELYEAIVAKPPPFPSWMSPEARHCIGHMLAKNPADRIQSVAGLAATPFFKTLDAKKMEAKEYPVPFKPQHQGDDTKYIDAGFKREKLDLGPDAKESKDGATIVFEDFSFIRSPSADKN